MLGLLMERIKGKKRGEEIERDLPFALMHLYTRLALGEKLETALEKTAESIHSALGTEFKKIAREINKKGASVEEAFLHSIERNPFIQFRRASSQIVSLNEQGFTKQELASLKSLHKELLTEQRTKIKDFAGKMVVYSLLFVAFSTVLPALFLALILIGSMFLELSVSPTNAFLIVILFFPVVDLIILFYIREKTPLFARC